MLLSCYRSADVTRDVESQREVLEKQADGLIDSLADKTDELIKVLQGMRGQIQGHQSIIGHIGHKMSHLNEQIGGSIKSIESITHSGGSKTMCYLAAFMMFVMLIFYWMLRMVF